MDHARRLAAYALVLRELVHRALGRLPVVAQLHDKRALGAHAYEDARSLAKLLRRLGELPTAEGLPGAPGPALAALFERDAYAEIKPALAAAVRWHLGRLDPVADEPELRILTQIAFRQERHLRELPARYGSAPADLPIDVEPGAGRLPDIDPVPAAPARDPFVALGGTGAVPINAALLAAEVAARTAHELPGEPWDFHADLARIVADRLRRTVVLEQRGERWGDEPVAVDGFAAVLGLDLAGRLAFAADPADPAHRLIAERWSA